MSVSKRTQFEILRAEMERERASFISHWKDLGDYILPMRPRFNVTDANKGNRKNTKINDTTATQASRTLTSGMMGGITNPARPWFKLTIQDKELAKRPAVEKWLDDVTTVVSNIFIKSNLYNALPIAYGELGTFGTACMFMEEDLDGGVVRFTPFPIGSYSISNNKSLKVDKFSREFRMTVRQIVEKFGTDEETGKINFKNISRQVEDLYDKHQMEQWIDVCHMITPNPDYKPDRLEAKFKKYRSVYFERGGTAGHLGTDAPSAPGQDIHGKADDEKMLRESGFDYFPALCPRWELTGEDVYGTNCPGMTAIGDVKQLQVGEKRSLQAIEKMINPPMIGGTHMRSTRASILPGDITFTDEREGTKGFRAAHEVRFDLNAMEGKQEQVRQRIKEAYFVDLFRMLSSDRRNQRATATEVDELSEEKLLALGPVLEQLNQDLYDPLIDNTLFMMEERELMPEPPEEIRGKQIKVEYISIMAQAQKLVGVAGLERASGYITGLATIDPSVMDKFNMDAAADEYGQMVGLRPGIIRDDEAAAAIRQQRAEQQRQQFMLENAQNLAGAAKDVSDTQIQQEESGTEVSNVLDGFGQ